MTVDGFPVTLVTAPAESPMSFQAMNPNGRKLHHLRLNGDELGLLQRIVDGETSAGDWLRKA